MAERPGHACLCLITFAWAAVESVGRGTAVVDLHFCEENKIYNGRGVSMTGVLHAAGVLAGMNSPAGEEELRDFRAGWYACLGARADALFELTDAVLSAPAITALPYLSLEPVFRRSWGSLYGALSEGVITVEKVRDLLVAHRLADQALTFAIDASTHPRPHAETSPGRQWHHLSGPGGVDGGVPGWAWQHLVQLNLDHDSWVAPLDVIRVEVGGPAQSLAAVSQVDALAGRLRATGQDGHKLFVFDAGYDLAVLAYELHGEADVTGEHATRCAALPPGSPPPAARGAHRGRQPRRRAAGPRPQRPGTLPRSTATPPRATADGRAGHDGTAPSFPAPDLTAGASPTSTWRRMTTSMGTSACTPGPDYTRTWPARSTSPTGPRRRS